jgi:thiol reductant ABC exporter CydC subunit
MTASGRGPVLRAASTARPVAGRLWLALLAGVVAAGSAVALTATSAWLISRAAEQPPILFLMVAIVAVRAFGISRGVFRYLERLASHDAAFRWLADLRVGVYERLERLAPTGSAAFRSGDLLSRLVNDVDTMQDLWLRVLLPYATAGVVGAGAVALTTWLLPAAGVVLLVTILVAAAVAPVLALSVARQAERRIAPVKGQLATAVQDTLTGCAELTAFGRVDEALARTAAQDAALSKAEGRSAAGAGLGAAVAAAAGGTAMWAGLALGVPAVRDGSLSGVALAVVVLTPLAVFELVSSLAPAAAQVPRVRAAARRVFEVLDAEVPVTEPTQPAPLPALPSHVRAEQMSARWVDQGSDVLDHVDLDLAPPEHVAVVGASGAGKSTLAAVLLKFLVPTTGVVSLDDVNYQDLDGDDVRRRVGLLAQDAHVFDTSVLENLRLARPDAGEDELRRALQEARLWDTVQALPDGWHTMVGEHGGRLSGGERQRLALARALLAEFDVLVLDEPTEHVDEATAAPLLVDLLAANATRSLLLITHRDVRDLELDRVLVLADKHLSTESALGELPAWRTSPLL